MKHMMMPHKEEIFSFVVIFGFSAPLQRCVGPKECPKRAPQGEQQFFISQLFCPHFLRTRGAGVGWGRLGQNLIFSSCTTMYDVGMYCTVLILLLPRILSCDKNLACTKNISACFSLLFTFARFFSSRVFLVRDRTRSDLVCRHAFQDPIRTSDWPILSPLTALRTRTICF